MLPDLGSMSGLPSYASLTGGKGGDSRSALTTSSAFDSSGWVVNMGGGSASGIPAQINPLLLAGLAVAGLVAWKLYLKK